jgi:hypothetical protein
MALVQVEPEGANDVAPHTSSQAESQ